MANKKRDNRAESAILTAARKVFTSRGYAAARMDEIAQEAGINRALLHYYFRSKEKLFHLVFHQRMKEFFVGLAGILMGPLSVEAKIRAVVEHDIDMIRSQPDLPIFIMNELARRPDHILKVAAESGVAPAAMVKVFKRQVKEEADKKTIFPIDGGQLLINIMSLCVYPFIAKPMVMAVQELNEAQFDKMILKRKQEVVEFVLNSIKPKTL